MKHYRLLMAFLLLTLLGPVVPAGAQNANRTGFFLELGAGFLTGKTQRVSLEMDSRDQIIANFAEGTALDLQFGVRIRTASNWAYEFRAAVEAPVNCITRVFSPKAFPIGFRYTSGELFGNMSLYAHFNLGAAMAARGFTLTTYAPGVKNWVRYQPHESCLSWGPVVSVGIGLNVTTHVYAGLAWDCQYMFKCYRTIEEENLLWGCVGLRVGYRF